MTTTMPLRARLRFARLRRRGLTPQARMLVALVALALVFEVLLIWHSETTPPGALVVPLLLSSLVLSPRILPWYVVFDLVLLLIKVVTLQGPPSRLTIEAVVLVFVCGLIVLLMSFRRSRLGVGGLQGESMFVDLRDRILNQSGIPELPHGWYAESALASAGGTLFAGDFVVASRPTPERLEVVVVDVSGKGEQAGTRALLLSGAFGGILGALPPEQFLPAANEYLLRQNWEEGFATAIHLSLNLVSGAFEIRTAGHPPAAQRSAGSGRWALLDSDGPILGLLPNAEFHPATGVLLHDDAVFLYTDGMVEEPRRDIDLGIDRLLGDAERLLRGDFHGAAKRLVESLGARDDDRAMFVVHRG